MLEMLGRRWMWAAGMLAASLLAGCHSAPHRPAPVEDRSVGTQAPASNTTEAAKPLPGSENQGKPGYYTVRPGDTLIRIALDSGQNWRDIARWNNLENPNLIEVGQVLRVSAPAATATEVARATPAPTAPPRAGVGSAAVAASVASAPPAGSVASIAPASTPAVPSEDDVVSRRERSRGKPSRQHFGVGVGVQTHVTEIATEASLRSAASLKRSMSRRTRSDFVVIVNGWRVSTRSSTTDRVTRQCSSIG